MAVLAARTKNWLTRLASYVPMDPLSDFLHRRKVGPVKTSLIVKIGKLIDEDEYDALTVEDVIDVLVQVMIWKGGEVQINGLSLVKALCSSIHSGVAADWGGEQFIEWFTKEVPRYEPDFKFEFYDGDDEDTEDDW